MYEYRLLCHPSQQLKCKRCHDVGHRAHNIDLCPAYITQQDKSTIFWIDTDVLSNFYMCYMSMFNNQFRSAEHAYQWCKCTYFELYDMAEQVLGSKTPRQAKQTTRAIFPEFLSLWNYEKRGACLKCLKPKHNHVRHSEIHSLGPTHMYLLRGHLIITGGVW